MPWQSLSVIELKPFLEILLKYDHKVSFGVEFTKNEVFRSSQSLNSGVANRILPLY